jgi:hemerythrin superfamily protein
MNAIKLLTNDHRDIDDLFARFEATQDPAVADQIVTALSIHTWIEEEFLYQPAIERSELLMRQVLGSFEEHHLIKTMLADLDYALASAPSTLRRDEQIEAIVKVLRSTVAQHIAKEEAEFFPAVQQRMGQGELLAIGRVMQRERELAPTRPGGAITRTLKRARDIGRGLFESAGMLMRMV